ncbi:MAG: hypothetical protein AB7S39_22760 [Gemmatimonadales bacterium]
MTHQILPRLGVLALAAALAGCAGETPAAPNQDVQPGFVLTAPSTGEIGEFRLVRHQRERAS